MVVYIYKVNGKRIVIYKKYRIMFNFLIVFFSIYAILFIELYRVNAEIHII